MTKRFALVLILCLVIAGAVVAFGFSPQTKAIDAVLGRGDVYVIRMEMPKSTALGRLPPILGPKDASFPLVVIDPGHGGKDPGASGARIAEKEIALNLALALRDELLKIGGVRVALTRSDDRFVILEDRPEIARRLQADLFISIHADSAGDDTGVSGASIYTLSDEASSQAAALFAQRENKANGVNGVSVATRDPQVNAILVELSQRRVQEKSDEFASVILRESGELLVFHNRPRRRASLAVLRAPDVPAILYEAGYITNAQEEQRLASDQGRLNFAQVMARSVQTYFARQAAAQ